MDLNLKSDKQIRPSTDSVKAWQRIPHVRALLTMLMQAGQFDTLLYWWTRTKRPTGYVFQGSGFLFWLVSYASILVRKHNYLAARLPSLQLLCDHYTPSQHLADIGLGASSLVFWNYAMCHDEPGMQYALVRGMDYTMIATNAIVSTCTHPILRTKRAFFGTATAMFMHYVSSGGMRNPDHYKTHIYLCVGSFISCMYKFAQFPQELYSAAVIRATTTVLCSWLYYRRFRKIHFVKDFRELPLWIPWLWHSLVIGSIYSNRLMMNSFGKIK